LEHRLKTFSRREFADMPKRKVERGVANGEGKEQGKQELPFQAV